MVVAEERGRTAGLAQRTQALAPALGERPGQVGGAIAPAWDSAGGARLAFVKRDAEAWHGWASSFGLITGWDRNEKGRSG